MRGNIMCKLYLFLLVAIYFVDISEQHYFSTADCTKGPQEPGAQCNALLHVWSWNDTDYRCTEVIYGGCRKTANNFQTREDCERIAAPICKARNFKVEDCSRGTENEEGPHCLALLRVWHWNNIKQKCEIAIYGGCNPSRNNFVSEYECKEVAQPVCKTNV